MVVAAAAAAVVVVVVVWNWGLREGWTPRFGSPDNKRLTLGPPYIHGTTTSCLRKHLRGGCENHASSRSRNIIPCAIFLHA